MILTLLLVSQLGQIIEHDPVVVFQGRIAVSVSDVGLDFRPCNEANVYFVDGNYAILESLSQFLQSGDSNKSVYVRFIGKVEKMSSQYEGSIRITKLINYSESIPSRCR